MRKGEICVVAGLLLGLAFPTQAQVTVGDNLSMNLNALVSAGYTADYGNAMPSDHGITFGGNGDLNGSYYDPNFLSFHLQPYYNQSRANSAFQSISDSSGLNASVALFSGSHFPGSISYSKNYNSEGNYGIPGLANYTTHGNSDVFSVGWGVNIPDRPTLSFNFQQGSNNYSIYGTNGESSSHFDSFSATSAYMLAGFQLTGSFQYMALQSQIPEIVAGQPEEYSSSDGTSYGFGVGHRLPLNGSFSAGVSRSDTSADFTGGNFTANIDTLNAGVSFNPIAKLSFGTNAQYNDNLAGTLYDAVLSAGPAIPGSNFQQSSHALDVNNYVTYRLPLNLTLMGTVDHRQQEIFGSSISADAYSGTLTYTSSLLGGFVSAVGGVTENVINVRNQNMLGLLGSLNYSRRVGRWTLSGGFNYAQNQQTLLIAYTTSSYGYNGSIGRRLGRTSHWGASATGSKTGLTNYPGAGTFTQSYSTAFSVKWLGVNGTYSKSSGNAILTGAGLMPTPLPLPVITPTSVVLYGGHSYSFGIGASPVRRLTLSGSYANAISDTLNSALTSDNRTEMLTAQVQYQFRQMYVQGGYTRLVQGFSLIGGVPTMVGSYYVGVSRWFNFF